MPKKKTRQRPPWVEELLDLAAQEATGRFVITGPMGDRAWMWVRDGLFTGVSAPMRRPLLARRLVAFQAMPASRVSKALESIRAKPGARLLDVLLAERLVPEEFVADFVRATMAEQMSSLLDSGVTEVEFQGGRTQRVSPILLPVAEVVSRAQAVPHRIPAEIAEVALAASATDFAGSASIDRSFLAACDGHRRPADAGDLCGLTAGETVELVERLRANALLSFRDSSADNWDEESAELSAVDEPAPAPTVTPAATAVPAAAAPPPPKPAPPAPVIQPVAPAPTAALPPIGPPPTGPRAEPPEELVRMADSLATTLPPGAEEEHSPDNVPGHDVAPPRAVSSESRRDAMSMLSSFGTSTPAPEPTPPASPSAPDAGPATVPAVDESSALWPSRLRRPTNPMSSGDVIKELHSLGDENQPADVPPPTDEPHREKEKGPEGRKRRFFGR